MPTQRKNMLPEHSARESNDTRGLQYMDQVTWRYTAHALLAISLLVWFGVTFSVPPASLHNWLVSAGFALLAAVASLLLGNLVVTLLGSFQRKVPELYRWILVGTAFLLFNLFMALFRQYST